MDGFVPIVHEPLAPRRRFIVVGSRARSSPDFRLHALGDSGGRMDILVRCIRAALLVSDGVRRDTQLDLLLLGGDDAPLALRLDGRSIRGLMPDERRNARLIQRALVARHTGSGEEVVAPGITAAPLDLAGLARQDGEKLFLLERGGQDIRSAELGAGAAAFVLGDDRGLSAGDLAQLVACGGRPLSLGAVELHTEDAVTLVHNELDRRQAARRSSSAARP